MLESRKAEARGRSADSCDKPFVERAHAILAEGDETTAISSARMDDHRGKNGEQAS